MSDKVKQLAPVIWAEIQKANKILLACHPRPDPDSVASNLAFKLAVEKLGKKVTLISGDDHKPPQLHILPGYDTIENKSLAEINFQDYDLFISIDVGDVKRLSYKKPISLPLPIPTIVIDHHKTSPGIGDINLIDDDAYSASEVVWEVLESYKEKLADTDIAICIYTGIWGDTGGLTSINARTMKVLSKCLEQGIEPEKIIPYLTQLSHNKMILMGDVLQSSKMKFGGKVLIAKVSYGKFQDLVIPNDEIGECKELILYELNRCSEALITSFVYEYKIGWVSISIRSVNPSKEYDVSIVAESMGGGGHPVAASAKFQGSVDEAEKKLLTTLQKIYPDLGQP